MAIETEEQTKLLKVIVGLYNATPGIAILAELSDAVDSGLTVAQVADILADHSSFTTGILGGQDTTAEQVGVMMSNFGFTTGNSDPESADALAEGYFTEQIDAGRGFGEIVNEVVTYFAGSPAAVFAEAVTLLDNKAAVSAAYSATKDSTDLGTLQTALTGIMGTAPLTQTEIDDLVAAAPSDGTFTLTAAADSVTEGGALIYTVTSSQAVTEDTDVVFTVVPGDAAAADQGTGTTNLNDFVSGTFNPVTVTIAAGDTTATFTVNGDNDGVTELAETFSISAVVDGVTLTEESTLLDGESVQIVPLTTGVDTLVGGSGNETFSGTYDGAATSTFNVADTVDGGGGTGDILNVVATDDAVVNLPPASISGIEIVNIRNVDGNAGAEILTVDGASFTGHTHLNSDRSTDSVTFINVASDASVGSVGNGNLTNGALVGTYVASATSPVLELMGGTSGTGAVTINAAGATSFAINSTGAVNGVGAITGPASATSLTINATTGMTTTGITAAGATSVTVSGAAATGVAPTTAGGSTSAVNIGAAPAAATTIDASGLTAGGLGVSLIAGITSFIGGQGDDTVTTAGLTATVDSQVNAGEGTGDRLIVGATADVNTSTEAKEYAGFEVLDIGAQTADVALFTNSAFTSVMIGGNGTFTNLSAAQAADVTVYANSSGTYGITDATMVGQLDTLALKVDDGLSATNTLTLADITAAGVETINIEATDNATVSALTGATALTGMNITGAGNVNVTTGALTLNVNTVIDASAATGTVAIDASAAGTNGISLIGTTSSKANTLAGTAQADSITAGAGTDSIDGNAGADGMSGGAGIDTFVYNTGDSVASSAQVFAGANLAAGDTITFGNGVDIINDFTAGATGDLFDGANAAAIPTTGIGVATAAGFAAGTTYFVSGAWAGGTFTAAADGTGADTLIVEGAAATALGASTDAIVLVGVDSDDLVAANFI